MEDHHDQQIEGARLRVWQLGHVALPPVQENHMPNNHEAEVHPAYTGDMSCFTVIPEEQIPQGQETLVPPISLVRGDEGATQAYAVLATPPREIGTNRDPNWGRLFHAVLYPRIGETQFFAPRNPTRVVVKRLNKHIVHDYLEQGGSENPYREVSRMQEIGDDVHVLRCIEFLEDEDYIYIITLAACQLGTLKDYIWGAADNLDEEQCRCIFLKILEILRYLARHMINHHDMSPDNFLFLTPDNLVVYDLAMSLRIPVNPETGQRALITGQGRFGTFAWMAPEAYIGAIPFDGVAMDLYAASVTLYNLLTRRILFYTPHPVDLLFRYFICSEMLWNIDANDRALDILNNNIDLDEDTHQRLLDTLWELSNANLGISAPAMDLLRNLLQWNPENRISLAEAMESDWVIGNFN
jgi:serine/threonine protein kinase